MQYFGGKAKIAKELCKFLQGELKEGQAFVDLFCGSCNVVSKIEADVRMANDLHPELIAMWKSTQDGTFKPYRVSEDEYKLMRLDVNNEAYPAWFRGFIGFGCAFAGDWFKGFAKCNRGDDYYMNALNSTNKKATKLQGVIFSQGSYKDVKGIPDNSLIYCDIPYKGTTAYSVGGFNHEEFYAWAIDMKKKGHNVLVSEYGYNVPEGWEVVYSIESKKDIRNKNGEQVKTVEVVMTPII